MNSRRQRYFRARSPSGREMDVLEQGQVVMEGDPGDEQRVSHEEIVDDGGTEMTIEHMRQQPPSQQQQQQQQIHYEERAYNSAPAPPRRPGRPGARYTNQQLPVDVIQKLQSKNMYMGVQRQGQPQSQSHTRISPGGARIVSLPVGARKREAGEGNGMVIKRQVQQFRQNQQQQQLAQSSQTHQASSQQQQQVPHISGNNKNVKVVRVVSNATTMRNNPALAEQKIAEIEERIKQTIEDTKIDMQKIKELQEQEMTPDEYHQLLGWLFGEIDRLNVANTSLTDFYRQRQRDEKTVFEARTDALNARIRQLETENRKLRENVLLMHQTRFEHFDPNIIGHDQVQQEEEHMGQIMEEADDAEHLRAKEEVPPEWIVEETVDDIHLQHVEDETQKNQDNNM